MNSPTRADLLQKVRGRLAAGEGFALATINLDHVVKLRNRPAFRDAYAEHDIVVADGRPIVWLSRLAGAPIEVQPGSDLIDPLCAEAVRLDLPVAFVGSTTEVIDNSTRILVARHPGLRVVARIAPPNALDPYGEDIANALAEVKASGARFCFLALGAPKQEIIAVRGRDRVPGCGFVSIGAGLDFITGAQVRAPKWVQSMAMEWFWRMVHNPRRLAKRYMMCLLILPGLAWRTWRHRRRTG